MKVHVLIAVVFLMVCVSCKLESSSAIPNSNANPSPSVESNTTSTPEQVSTCSLAKAAAPVTEGLKLGMTSDEILAILPGSKNDAEVKSALAKPASPLGVSDFVVHADKLQPTEKFANINHFTFSLLDGRVSTINIGYNGPAYASVDQFVSKFVEATSLPPVDQWQGYVGMDNLKMLTCKDFEVRVFAGGKGGNLNYVLLTDLDAQKKLKDRRAKAKAQASPTP
ncbi:MAG: hypothetical protein ABR607_08995 [Pyrinomonadaceae bacterium]